MPSPFPGMDPFFEGQRWRSFHASFMAEVASDLVRQLRPTYVVDMQTHDYPAGTAPAEAHRWEAPPWKQVRIMLSPTDSRRPITAIEHLLPWNKHPRSIGEYRRRICKLIDAGLNLVEIDLLRAGRPSATGCRETTTTS